MSNEDNRSKWDDLAQQLGVSPEPLQEPEPAPPREEVAEEPAAPKGPAIVVPERRGGDWAHLAADLGLEAAPTPPVEERAVEEPEESPLPVEESSIIETEPEEPVGMPAELAEIQEEALEEEPEPMSEEAPKTLWERIFGSPTRIEAGPVATPADERSVEPSRRDQNTSWDDDRDESREARGSGEVRDESEGEPEPRRRRSRRRRRRRGGKSADRAPAAAGPDGEDELDALDDESPLESDLEDGLDDLENGEATDSEVGETRKSAAEDGGRTRRSGATSRNIPTWEEAISLVVDANLQSRPDRRSSRSSGRNSRGGRRRRRN